MLAELDLAESKLSAKELATLSGLPAPMAAKVLKQLHKHGILSSSRGVNGGYELVKSTDQISVADLIEVVEGPVALTECALPGTCNLESHCKTRPAWQALSNRVRKVLEDVSIRDLTQASEISGTPHKGAYYG